MFTSAGSIFSGKTYFIGLRFVCCRVVCWWSVEVLHGGLYLLVLLLVDYPLDVFTRGGAVANAIHSTVSIIVNTSMAIGNGGSINAVASVSNGFGLSMPTSTGRLIISFMNCSGRAMLVNDGARFSVALGRSDIVLSRMITVNCTGMGHESLAKTASSISTKRLTTMPMVATTRTLRNGTTNIGVIATNNTPNTGIRIAIHNNASVARDAGPLCVMSKFRVRSTLAGVSVGSVRGVSVLGSTSSATVCKTQNSGNVVLVAAGSKGGNGARIACGACFSFSGLSGGLSVVSGTRRFAGCRCRLTTLRNKLTGCDGIFSGDLNISTPSFCANTCNHVTSHCTKISALS